MQSVSSGLMSRYVVYSTILITSRMEKSIIKTVKSFEDVIAALQVVHDAYIKRVYENATRKLDRKTTVSSQVEVPTVKRIMDSFGISRQAARTKLTALEELHYIIEDPIRSYDHYAKNKTRRTIFKLTESGRLLLKTRRGSSGANLPTDE